jgi:hypothetical protein
LILCSACTTKTVIKLKPIEIPTKYLDACIDPKFQPTQEAVNKAKNGNYKFLSIEQAKHSKAQTKEIERCDRNILDIIKLQKELIKKEE